MTASLNNTHIGKWGHAEWTGKAVVQTAVQTHWAVCVPTGCCDWLPQCAATQHTVKICLVDKIWIHRQVHQLHIHPYKWTLERGFISMYIISVFLYLSYVVAHKSIVQYLTKSKVVHVFIYSSYFFIPFTYIVFLYALEFIRKFPD
jgi:hypothetical protein